MSVRKICILGMSFNGIPLSAIIALKCPEIRVYVVQKNSEFVYSMNSRQIPPELFVPGIEDLIRKSQNKNLFFTTNENNAIKEAKIIFIMSSSKMKASGEGKNQMVDLSKIEDAATLIAEYAESDKIIVENSSLPLKTAECVRNILTRNGKPRVKFEVLSNPEFYEQGSSLLCLLNPDYVLIGSENTSKGLAAAKVLAGIYERWIPSKNIILRNIWSSELSKICTYAMMAQMYSSLQSIAAICEEGGGDVSVCRDVIGKARDVGKGIFHACFNVGKYPLAVRIIVYLCESFNFTEEANYWRAVLEMFKFYKTRLFKCLIWNLNGNVTSRRITLLGFAYFKDTEEVAEGSSAVDLCTWLVEERAFVNVYHSKMTKKHVIEALSCSMSETPMKEIERLLLVFNDPYKAIEESQVVILCYPWPEFTKLDYEKAYNSMKKPAYIFDMSGILPHSMLSKIGFRVFAQGKFIEKTF